MISDIQQYPSYKLTGEPWLSQVPAHWPLPRTKSLFRERNEKDHPDEPLLAATQTKGVIAKGDYESRTVLPLKDLQLLKLVRAGDFVISLRSFQGGIEYARTQGIISPAYTVLYPLDPTMHDYLAWLFKSSPYLDNLVLSVTGIRQGQNIDYQRLGVTRVPVPPADEQHAISRYLAYADIQIGRYLQRKKRLIALLNEQRQAIIQRAVTRGLDPSVRLKPSGATWLGDVPEHWTIKRFKYVATVTSGQIDPRAQAHRQKVLIAPNHIESGTGRIVSESTADEQGADSGKYEVRRGQIVYSKIRPNLRKATIAPADCLCSADMYPISVRESEVHPAFMLMLLLSAPFTQYVVDRSLRVAMPKVNREALGYALVWFPNLDEQNRILQFVANATGPLETAVDRARREIGLVREFRSRLITDVVIGRVDVREAATQLPSEGVVSESNEDVGTFAEDDSDPNGTGEAVVLEGAEA